MLKTKLYLSDNIDDIIYEKINKIKDVFIRKNVITFYKMLIENVSDDKILILVNYLNCYDEIEFISLKLYEKYKNLTIDKKIIINDNIYCNFNLSLNLNLNVNVNVNINLKNQHKKWMTKLCSNLNKLYLNDNNKNIITENKKVVNNKIFNIKS